MVGLDLMAALLQAIRSDTRLILLGDKDQLPSVQAGAVLAHLIPEDGCAHFGTELSNGLRAILPDLDVAPAAGGHRLQDVLVVLQENYRSQREIQEAARAVNGLDTALVDRLPRFNLSNQGAGPKEKAEDGFVSCSFAELEQRGGCWLSEPATDSLAGWRSFLTSWAEHHFLSAMVKGTTYQELVAQYRVSEHQEIPLAERAVLDQLFTLLGRARILTLLREGFWGSGGVNRLLGQFLGPHLDARGGVNLFAGAPVLITRNDPSRGLFNGDIGIALRCGTSSRRVVFQRQDGYVSLPVDVLPTHEPAFALTVHKSQGGEYGQVLLVLPPEGGRGLLTRELIYTGITRARQLAIIYGTAEMLRTAISRRIKRESALLAYQS
jgi:exodeoxyribonuclease V alpha subunit